MSDTDRAVHRLAELCRRLDAGAGGVRAPAAYGYPRDEYDALRDGCGVVVRPRVEEIEVSGPDRARFLNGLLTCAVGDLADDAAAYGFFTDVKGRVLADAVIVGGAERWLLELPEGRGEAIREHAERYKIADRVELRRPQSASVAVSLVGPGAGPVLASLGLEPAPRWRHREEELFGVRVRRLHRLLDGADAVDLRVPAGDAAELVAGLLDAAGDLGLTPVGENARDTVRVEEGVPRFGVDFGPDHFPQESGLEALAVSYEKGCYLGQEVVARIHYRGNVQRRPCLLLPRSGELAPGETLVADDREVGRVTSLVDSPRRDGALGLAVLHRRAEDGARIRAEGGAEVEVEEVAGAAVDGDGDG